MSKEFAQSILDILAGGNDPSELLNRVRSVCQETGASTKNTYPDPGGVPPEPVAAAPEPAEEIEDVPEEELEPAENNADAEGSASDG